jgi:hypothetical protein
LGNKSDGIREAKDLIKLPLKELIDSLMTHEITMEKQELEEKPKKNLAFKIIHHVDNDDDDDDDDEVEEDIALITRQFWNFLRKKEIKNSQTLRRMEIRKNLAKRNLNATSATRQGHIKTDCLLLQNKKMNCYHK